MDKRKVDLIYKHGETEGVRNTGGEIGVDITLKDYNGLVEEKNVAQVMLRLCIQTIEEIRTLIAKNITIENYKDILYMIDEIDEVLEKYYG